MSTVRKTIKTMQRKRLRASLAWMRVGAKGAFAFAAIQDPVLGEADIQP